MNETVSVMTPAIQLGFAGFCFVLLALVFWMIRDNRTSQREQSNQLIGVIEKNTEVISKNTSTINSLLEQGREELTLLREVHGRIFKREKDY